MECPAQVSVPALPVSIPKLAGAVPGVARAAGVTCGSKRFLRKLPSVKPWSFVLKRCLGCTKQRQGIADSDVPVLGFFWVEVFLGVGGFLGFCEGFSGFGVQGFLGLGFSGFRIF